MPLFSSFADELQYIQLQKHAGLGTAIRSTHNWLKGQYADLGSAAAHALNEYKTYSPVLGGQASPPILGTIKNFLGSKLPKPTKPPGPVIEGVQKIFKSKPIQTVIPLADQASEFLKLGFSPIGIEKLARVMPYQQKTQYSCSAACLKAVLGHWGADRYAEHEIMHAIGVRQKGGAEVTQITEGAHKLGFDAYDKLFSSLDEAKQLTDKDVPIIADFQSFNNPGSGHYVVITAVDDNVVHLMDPNTPGNQRVITRAECEKRWWDRTMAPPHKVMPKWGVVVTPRAE